jgi:hypothetical protein
MKTLMHGVRLIIMLSLFMVHRMVCVYIYRHGYIYIYTYIFVFVYSFVHMTSYLFIAAICSSRMHVLECLDRHGGPCGVIWLVFVSYTQH